jgi:hypothetical protein
LNFRRAAIHDLDRSGSRRACDGPEFTFVGSVIGGPPQTEGFVDIAGLFDGPFHFVRILNTPFNDGDGIDLDAVAGLNRVPKPFTALLFSIGLFGLAARDQRV